MKNSWAFGENYDPKFRELILEDRREIDGRDKRHRVRIMFYDRLEKSLGLVRKHFPDPHSTRVGDFGCAQANFGMLLAERGYDVYAVDMDAKSLEYAKLKYERGAIHWILGKFSDIQLPLESFDVILMNEVITTFAAPAEVLGVVMRYLRPGGLLIGTFPNGADLRNPLKTYEQLLREGTLKTLGPKEDGLDHLYKVPPEQLKYLVPEGAELIERGFCGCTWLLNKYSQPVVRVFPPRWVEKTVRSLSMVPLINRKTFILQFVVLKKVRRRGSRAEAGG